MYKVGIGQDSHRFTNDPQKKCILGGIEIEGHLGFDADSDGDIIFHSLCNAITSVTHVPILGDKAIRLCHDEKILDSQIYLQEALKTLTPWHITHVAITLEGKTPRLQKIIEKIRLNIARLLQISYDDVGITITSGNGLTRFSDGMGMQAIAIITLMKNQ
jgi:2-C-methyl-D-erythritol 2,4-cyclodiphosphate synthase